MIDSVARRIYRHADARPRGGRSPRRTRRVGLRQWLWRCNPRFGDTPGRAGVTPARAAEPDGRDHRRLGWNDGDRLRRERRGGDVRRRGQDGRRRTTGTGGSSTGGATGTGGTAGTGAAGATGRGGGAGGAAGGTARGAAAPRAKVATGGTSDRGQLRRGGARHGRQARAPAARPGRGGGQRPLRRQQRRGSIADHRLRDVQRDDLRRGRRRQDRQHHGDPGRADRGRRGGRRYGHGPVGHLSLGPDRHQQRHAPRARVGRRAQDVADGELPDERRRLHHLHRHLSRHRAHRRGDDRRSGPGLVGRLRQRLDGRAPAGGQPRHT